jgi:hypothetical protein
MVRHRDECKLTIELVYRLFLLGYQGYMKTELYKNTIENLPSPTIRGTKCIYKPT